jgi:hypothetical protein
MKRDWPGRSSADGQVPESVTRRSAYPPPFVIRSLAILGDIAGKAEIVLSSAIPWAIPHSRYLTSPASDDAPIPNRRQWRW